MVRVQVWRVPRAVCQPDNRDREVVELEQPRELVELEQPRPRAGIMTRLLAAYAIGMLVTGALNTLTVKFQVRYA